MQWRYDGQPAGNGRTSESNNAAFGTDYIRRIGRSEGLPLLQQAQRDGATVYTANDSKLQPLEGKSSYRGQPCPKGQLPPVKGFWSLTVYNPEHLFYANALKRYALGTKNKSLISVQPRWQLDHLSRGTDRLARRRSPTGYRRRLEIFRFQGPRLLARPGHPRRHLEAARIVKLAK